MTKPYRTVKENTVIVFDYLKRFPNTTSKALARKIYSDHPGFFTCFEQVFLRIRYYRGQTGKLLRSNIANREFIQPLKAKYMKTEFNLPESHTKSRGIFTFPTGCKKLGVFGDVHIPFHDNIAL